MLTQLAIKWQFKFMLTNSFIHIQSIGAITEQRLWETGIRDWDSFTSDLPIPISPGRKHFLLKGIEESKRHFINLIVTAYNLKLKDTPFYENMLITESPPPANPYRVDLATVDRIKRNPLNRQSQQWY